MAFTVFRIIVVILGIIGTTYIIPEAVALYCKEYEVLPYFIIPMVASWLLTLLVHLLAKKKKTNLSTRSAFVVVALSWFAASLFGAIPLYFSGAIPKITDAFFESASGFTTTGITILNDIEALPRSINLWRCQTHWLGGMGIVALTVALLPILGVGGFQLVKAETTGPEKGKLTPKITTTSKILWIMYFSLTVAECIALKIAGMDFIDALSHAFSTLGTGGFSTRNASIAAYNSVSIDVIITIFMFLAGINFSLYYYVFARKWADIKDNTEFKAYLIIFFTAALVITGINTPQFKSFFTSARYSIFQTASIISTTGFGTNDYTTWHTGAQAIILALFFIGGMSGSTSGGVKVIRWVVLGKILHNEFSKMIHPHGVFQMRINKQPARKELSNTVAAFFFVYISLILFSTFYTCLFGIDVFTSFSGALSMLGNVGPGFNLLGPSFNASWLPAAVKWMYCILMIAGRLEFFTIVIFLSPSFWKK